MYNKYINKYLDKKPSAEKIPNKNQLKKLLLFIPFQKK